MNSETTFFSYAREDSDFALKLANDLRQAGANIWLDQLDIEPGSRWDISVEKSLNDCNRLLVILSPDSISSNNVMDEVSFALEENKKIIPVLFKPCKVPFRLRRLQHANFTESYDEGLNNLLGVLNLEKRVLFPSEKEDSKNTFVEDQESEKSEDKKKAAVESLKAQTEAKIRQSETGIKNQAGKSKTPNESERISDVSPPKKKHYKKALIIGGIVVSFILIWILSTSGGDNSAWTDALYINTIESFETYLEEHPKGKHSYEAHIRINEAKEEAENKLKTERDLIDWESASILNTKVAYLEYLKNHPNGLAVAEAEERLSGLESQQKRVNTNDIDLEDDVSESAISPSQKLVGLWEANDIESLDLPWNIRTYFGPDGIYESQWSPSSGSGETSFQNGTWQYSNGILFQQFPNGASGRGRIRWISNDRFELTIIDNGVPSDTGTKRYFQRVH